MPYWRYVLAHARNSRSHVRSANACAAVAFMRSLTALFVKGENAGNDGGIVLFGDIRFAAVDHDAKDLRRRDSDDGSEQSVFAVKPALPAERGEQAISLPAVFGHDLDASAVRHAFRGKKQFSVHKLSFFRLLLINIIRYFPRKVKRAGAICRNIKRA